MNINMYNYRYMSMFITSTQIRKWTTDSVHEHVNCNRCGRERGRGHGYGVDVDMDMALDTDMGIDVHMNMDIDMDVHRHGHDTCMNMDILRTSFLCK
jgi:hypothetical protein